MYMSMCYTCVGVWCMCVYMYVLHMCMLHVCGCECVCVCVACVCVLHVCVACMCCMYVLHVCMLHMCECICVCVVALNYLAGCHVSPAQWLLYSGAFVLSPRESLKHLPVTSYPTCTSGVFEQGLVNLQSVFDLPIMATAVFDLPIMATAVGVNSCRTRGRIMLLVLISNDDADTLVPDQSTIWEQNKTVFKQIPMGVLKVLFLYRLLDTVHSTAIPSRLATHMAIFLRPSPL